MSSNRIRPIAIAVVRNGERFLVEHGFDSVKNQYYLRPPGGGIEFGEMSVNALRREFREEFDAELTDHVLQDCVAQKLTVNEHTIAVEDNEGRAEHLEW